MMKIVFVILVGETYLDAASPAILAQSLGSCNPSMPIKQPELGELDEKDRSKGICVARRASQAIYDAMKEEENKLRCYYR